MIFTNITTDISNAAIATVSVHKNYLRVTLVTIDATPLNYNTLYNDRTGKNSFNSTFINTQETLIEREILHNKIFKLHHFLQMRK